MKKKVVLFHGRASTFEKRINIAPLALLHISSLLVKDGFQVKIISDTLYDNYIEEALKECKDSVCLGVTAMTGSQIAEGLKISSLAKERYPQLPVVWGGWHPSIMPESTLKDRNVDIVIAGQGESKFFRLVKNLFGSDRHSLKEIPGLSFKDNGLLMLNNEFALEDMDSFPSIPYDIISDIEKCFNKTEYGNRTLQYISSYGCPYRCSFCIEPVVNKRRWSGLSAGRVVEDWEYLHKKYGIDAVAIYDSNFFVDKKRVAVICEGLLRKGIKIKWGNVNGRIPQLVKYEAEIWKLMEAAGLKMILTGSESGEQEILDLIQKDANLEDIYKFSVLCNRHNIKILFSYMSGMPWSDDAGFNRRMVNREIKSMLSQVDKLLRITNRNRFMVYAYTPLPGSAMYEMALKYGFQEPKTLRGWSDLLYSPEDIFKGTSITQKWISSRQLRIITMLEQYIFGMMDLDARDWIAKSIDNIFLRNLFRLAFNAGYLLARIRLKLRIFAFPLDYWFFIKFRKRIGV